MKKILTFFLLPGSLVYGQERLPQADTTALKEVVITGQFSPQSLKNSVYRVRTIDQRQIRLRAVNTVEALLSLETGIRFSNDLTLGESDVQLMGMSGQNVKVLLDGVPLVERGATKQSLSQVDIHTIDRVEIVEGPMSVVYGTDALAGVINLITKKPLTRLSVSGVIREETTGQEYQGFANDGTHNGSLALHATKSAWQFGLSGTRNDFGGWKGSATGRQNQWNPKEQWMAGARIGYGRRGLNAWYRLDRLDETIYSYGPLNPNNYRARDQQYATTRYTHQLQSDLVIAPATSLSTALSYQDYRRATHTTIYDATTGTRERSTGDGDQDVSGFSSAFLRSTLQARLSSKLVLQPGVELNLNEGSGQRISGNPRVNDYAFFLSAEARPLSRLSIRPGFRFTHNSVYQAPKIIPSLSAKVVVTPAIDVRLSYARGFRAPSLRELYFNFFDASHSIRGNENLEAEYSNSYNGSLSWKQTALGLFYNRFSNQITTGYLPGDNSVVTYINIARFRTTGLTLEQKFSAGRFSGSAGASYIGRFNRLSESEAGLPGMLWSPEMNTNLVYEFPAKKASLAVFYKYTGARQAFEVLSSGVSRTKVSGFHMADLAASKPVGRLFMLNAGVRNLFDVVSLKNSSTDTGGAHSTGGPVPVGYGRSYFLGLSFSTSSR